MIRAAIVGMGTWGQNLVASVQGKSDAIRFVAGTTRTPAKAIEFAAKHGIWMVDSYEQVLADGDIDAVVLATPHSMHSAQILAAANAGKSVFVEKPLGLTRQLSEEAVQACANANVTLAVGYNCLAVPIAIALIAALGDHDRMARGRLPSATTGASSLRCARSSECWMAAASASCCTSKAISVARARTGSDAGTGDTIVTKSPRAA